MCLIGVLCVGPALLVDVPRDKNITGMMFVASFCNFRNKVRYAFLVEGFFQPLKTLIG